MIAFRRITPLTLLGTAALLAACSGKKDATADSTSTSTTTTSSTSATTTPAPSPTPSADSTAAASGAATDPAHFTDANILAKEIGGDSAEVQVATLAKSMGGPGVKSYASMLIADHGKGLKEAQSTASKAAITPAAPAGDTTAQATDHIISRLKGLAKGPAFDTVFVNHEIEDHQEDIKDAQAMAGAAKDAKVKALVEKSLPELKKHLAAAQKLAGAKS